MVLAIEESFTVEILIHFCRWKFFLIGESKLNGIDLLYILFIYPIHPQVAPLIFIIPKIADVNITGIVFS